MRLITQESAETDARAFDVCAALDADTTLFKYSCADSPAGRVLIRAAIYAQRLAEAQLRIERSLMAQQ